MAIYGFFIDQTYLKDNSPLNNAIDMSEVYPFIKGAQDTYIREAIGSCLYDDLQAKIIASKASPPVAISTNDKTLIYKIRDCLVWLVPYDALPFINIKVRNIGVVSQSGDSLETAGRSDVSYLRNICKNKADIYIEELQRYLCENDDLYSEYECSNWNCSKLFPNTNTSNSMGIVLDRCCNDQNCSCDKLKWFR